MKFIKLHVRRFAKEELGASMVEYGIALLVVAGLGVGIMSVIADGTAQNVGAACNSLSGNIATTAAGITC